MKIRALLLASIYIILETTMKRLLGYMKLKPVESILAPLFKMLEALFELFVPLLVADMVDRGIGGSDTSFIVKNGVVLILLGIVGFVSAITAQYFAAKSAVAVGTAMRRDLFSHINSLTYREIDETGVSTLITRMTADVDQVQNGVNMFLRLFMRSPFVVFGAMIMAFTVDAKIAWIFVVTIALLLVVVFLIPLVCMPLYKKVQAHLDRVMLTTRENLSGVRVIRAFNRQKEENTAYAQENGLLFRAQIFVGKISALLNPVTFVIINLAIVLLLYCGALRVDEGGLSQGDVIALVNYMSQILVELVKLVNFIILMSKANASLHRVNSVFSVEPSVDEHTGETLGAEGKGVSVELRDVNFTYPGASSEAIDGISFSVGAGETVGIIGGTGSGKSTLVNLVPRFYEPDSGEIYINGKKSTELSVEALREAVAVVPQRAALFSGDIRSNLKMGKADADDWEMYTALEVAQALDFVEEKGEGLDFHIEQGGRNLSGGQKQRLTIARALVRRPSILILDDSASALDFATDARLRAAIKEYSADMTVFIVSQRVGTVRSADKIAVLDDGRLAGFGTHAELLRCCDVYREICHSQLDRKEIERDEQQ